MNKRKINIPIKSKLIIKNKSPKNKNEILSKILNKKDNKSTQQIIIKQLDFYSKKSPQKINIAENKNIKNNEIKKNKESKIKNRQNKFLNKQVKEKGPPHLNPNLNIYRVIHSKDNKCIKDTKQNSSVATDSINSYMSNMSNKIGNNNYFSILNIYDNYDSFSKKKIDSDISSNSKKDNIKPFYVKKENTERNQKSKNIQIKNAAKKIRINMLHPKSLRSLNKSKNRNINENPTNGIITKEKEKQRNNMKENKSEYNINNFKKINKSKYKDKNNKFNKKDKEKVKEEDSFNKIKDDNLNKFFFNLTENKYTDCNFNKNKNGNSTFVQHSNKFNKEKESDIKQNLNPVKKSLFSDHMNFLLNHKDKKSSNNEINCNDYFVNIPYNSILDSTDKIDYESKFINYDLGKTTGTSISRESVYALSNKNNVPKKGDNKRIEITKNQNLKMNVEEKERSFEEMEKLAKDYLNMTKYLEKKDEQYKQKMILTNTITTIIDNNNYNEDTIFPDNNY